MKLPLAYYGEGILRKKGAPVTEITDEIRALVKDMEETLSHHGTGIGLAAPQVKQSLSLFIIKVPERQEDGSWIEGKVRVFINPKIISVSSELNVREEGCLSIPGIYAEVVRPVSVKIRATDLDGNVFEEEFTGLEGRCVLHENDHINGVLFVDRIRGKERNVLEPKLQAIKKKYS
jgi:peptide deformylase